MYMYGYVYSATQVNLVPSRWAIQKFFMLNGLCWGLLTLAQHNGCSTTGSSDNQRASRLECQVQPRTVCVVANSEGFTHAHCHNVNAQI